MLIEKTIIDPEQLFKDIPTLETPRLRLRKIITRDANDIFEYASDPEVSKYVTWEHHRSVADSIHYVRTIINTYNRGEPTPWGIILKENHKLIGTGGYHWWFPEHARAEVGYAISARYWNMGFMTEALKVILEFGFDKMLLNRIEARCYKENTASERVLIKCGMKDEGMMRESLFIKGEFKDLKMFAILRSDYKKMREKINPK